MPYGRIAGIFLRNSAGVALGIAVATYILRWLLTLTSGWTLASITTAILAILITRLELADERAKRAKPKAARKPGKKPVPANSKRSAETLAR
jgi:hypothetical protein